MKLIQILTLLALISSTHTPVGVERIPSAERIGQDLSCSKSITPFLSKGIEKSSVDKLFSNSYISRLQDWRKFPDFDSELNNYVHSLLNLSPAERSEFLKKLEKRTPPLDPRAKKVLSLILYDKKSWEQYVEALSQQGDFYGFLSNSFVPVIEKMPEKLKTPLMSKVAKLYPTASKRIYTPRGERFYPPKRSLDLLLRHLLPPESMIEKLIKEGKTPLQAYQLYLIKNKKAFEEVEGYAKYDAEDAMVIYREIQNFLIHAPGSDGERKMLLFGSFPGGRANILNPESDIDFYYTSTELEDSFGDLKSMIHSKLKKKYPEYKLDLSGHFESDYPAVEAARVSPIQIEITPNSISLIIYPKIILPAKDANIEITPLVYELVE